MAARNRKVTERKIRVEIEPILQPFAERLKHDGGWPDFRSLVEDGCDANALLIAFNAVVPYGERDKWIWLFGFGRRDLTTAINALRKAGNMLQRLTRSQAAYECGQRQPKLDIVKLQVDLRRYADCLSSLKTRASGFQPRSKPNFNSVRISITKFVTETSKSGRPHDAEVAHILSVLTRRKITSDSQKDWRTKNIARIRKANRSLPMAAPYRR